MLLWVLASVFSGCLKNRPPAAAWYFAALALFWAGQARLMEVNYTGQNDMAAWSFLILALGAWAARGWINKIGHLGKHVYAMISYSSGPGQIFNNSFLAQDQIGFCGGFYG